MLPIPPASSTKLLVVCPAKSSAVGVNEFKMQFRKAWNTMKCKLVLVSRCLNCDHTVNQAKGREREKSI